MALALKGQASWKANNLYADMGVCSDANAVFDLQDCNLRIGQYYVRNLGAEGILRQTTPDPPSARACIALAARKHEDPWTWYMDHVTYSTMLPSPPEARESSSPEATAAS